MILCLSYCKQSVNISDWQKLEKNTNRINDSTANFLHKRVKADDPIMIATYTQY